MPQITALGFVVGFFTIVSHKPQMIGVIVGIFAIMAVLSTVVKLARN